MFWVLVYSTLVVVVVEGHRKVLNEVCRELENGHSMVWALVCRQVGEEHSMILVSVGRNRVRDVEHFYGSVRNHKYNVPVPDNVAVGILCTHKEHH